MRGDRTDQKMIEQEDDPDTKEHIHWCGKNAKISNFCRDALDLEELVHPFHSISMCLAGEA